jgi:hypothetical protein
VNKVVGKDIQKTPISLGIVGSNGLVEVLDSLVEGDIVGF